MKLKLIVFVLLFSLPLVVLGESGVGVYGSEFCNSADNEDRGADSSSLLVEANKMTSCHIDYLYSQLNNKNIDTSRFDDLKKTVLDCHDMDECAVAKARLLKAIVAHLKELQ